MSDQHLETLAFFEALCAERNIHIHQRIALYTEEDKEVHTDANHLADLAIFVLAQR